MVKASAEKVGGGRLIIFGLSDRNEAELRKDRPIVAQLSELGAGDGELCLAYKRPDGRVALPKGFGGIVLAFTDDDLECMRSSFVEGDMGELKFFLFRRKDEAAMEEILREFIGPDTKVRREGFAPSDRPPGRN